MDFSERLKLIPVDGTVYAVDKMMRRLIVHEQHHEQNTYAEWHWCHDQNENFTYSGEIEHKKNTGSSDQSHYGNENFHVLEPQKTGTGKPAVLFWQEVP